MTNRGHGSREPEPLEESTPSGSAFRAHWAYATVALVLGSTGLIVLFWETATSIALTWHASDTYGHGFLIIPICGYLLWLRRKSLAALAPTPSLPAIMLVAAMAFAWKIGEATTLLAMQQFALVAMIQALFVTVLGFRVTKAIAFPLFYLYFAVPFGGFLIAPLQTFTAQFIARFLQISGTPVHLEGVLIYIPSGTFSIVEACAGVRFLLSSVAIGFLATNLFLVSWKRRLSFIGLSILVPILANGLRAYGIVMIAHLAEFKLAKDIDHITYGFVFLSFVTLALVALATMLRERDWQDLFRWNSPSVETPRPPRPYRSYLLAMVGALSVVAGMLAIGSDRDNYPVLGPIQVTVPAVKGPWKSVHRTTTAWAPWFPGSDGEVRQAYATDDRVVNLYVAYYHYERQGAEVINEQNRFADESLWLRLEAGRIVAAVDDQALTVRVVRLVSPAIRKVIWYWYWVDGQFTASPSHAKLLQAKVRLFGGLDAAAIIAIAANYDDEPSEATDAIQSFLVHVMPLKEWLDGVGRRSTRRNGMEN